MGEAATAWAAGRGAGPGTTLALKEWAAVAHALLQGRQTILLRKGGIHERAFGVRGARFVLFPTVEHSHRERVRPEHADLLALGEADATSQRLVVRCAVTLVDVTTVTDPEPLAEVRDLHVYTPEHVAERFAFRPRHPLHVLVVRAVPLAPAVALPASDEFGGCRSWLDLPVSLGGADGPSPLSEEHLAAVAARVRQAVS